MKINRMFVTVFTLLFASVAFADNLKVTSTAVKQGVHLSLPQVFNGMGCTGDNISPDLKWTGAPKNTKAFAVTLYDPDAPTGSGWWHWVVFNIPSDVTSLPAGIGLSAAKLVGTKVTTKAAIIRA